MYDSDILYIRKKSESKYIMLVGDTNHTSSIFGLTFVVVAGTVYPMFKQNYKIDYNDKRWLHKRYSYYKDIDAVKRANKNNKKWDEEWYKSEFYNSGWFHKSISEVALNLTDEISKLSSAPIYIVDINKYKEAELIENPCLKDYDFQSVLDPYTIYQELTMWFNNQAISTYPPQITDNKVNIERHGFDYKTSFRKSPTKKRKR